MNLNFYCCSFESQINERSINLLGTLDLQKFMRYYAVLRLDQRTTGLYSGKAILLFLFKD